MDKECLIKPNYFITGKNSSSIVHLKKKNFDANITKKLLKVWTVKK